MLQGLDRRLPTHYEVAIFRFIQEALSNVAKHANATQARVLLETNAGSIHVSIEDDGSGFHIAEVLSDQSERRNLGIATLRQQAEALLRGEFGIESSVGRGTRVAAVVAAALRLSRSGRCKRPDTSNGFRLYYFVTSTKWVNFDHL